MLVAEWYEVSSTPAEPASPVATARQLQSELLRWLVKEAYPLWSSAGMDQTRGGFHERLAMDGTALREARRARVPPRQAYAFARAPEAAWRGDAIGIVAAGLHEFQRQYRRADGLYRTLVAPDGTPLDDAALLYDQAFALLGFAAARRLLGPGHGWEHAGLALLELLHSHLRREDAGFDSGLPARLPLLSNPHMHLFEALLDWRDLGTGIDTPWRRSTDDIGALALSHLIDADTGVVREVYDAGWSRAPGLAGRIIESGHLYEWAWLLLRWNPAPASAARFAACRLIELGERCVLRNGLVADMVLDDLSVHRSTARLWPQAERLKALALAAALTGEEHYWVRACAAASALQRYLRTPVAGLWYDRAGVDGALIAEPAPASSFYHIVAAILALNSALNSQQSDQGHG